LNETLKRRGEADAARVETEAERRRAVLRQDLPGEVEDLAPTKLAAAGRKPGEGRTKLQSEVLNEMIEAGQ
jgi:hypothetical protein